jgi:branched-chain amino acid transport system substrate-binding protein
MNLIEKLKHVKMPFTQLYVMPDDSRQGEAMKELDIPSGMNRRQFLVKAGLAGAMAAIPFQAHEAGWTNTKLVVEKADNGSSIVKARRLLAEGKVDILTGMINPLIVHRLREDLEKSEVLYINMEGGANSYAPREESPLLFHNSLGYWQSSWSLGSWAATAMGKRGFVASSLYETGYDAYYAFPQGFEQAGGTIIRSELTHLAPGGNNLASLMTAIAAARPDFVYASYSGREAVDFVRAYAAAGLSGRIPLLASGFTVDESLLPAMGANALGIKSCLSWSPTITTPENMAFRKAYTRQTRREADHFALLGYDTGSLITAAVKTAKGTVIRSNELKQALEKTAIPTPRGSLRIEPRTGSTDSPLYLREVRRDGNMFCNTVISELPGLAATEIQADRESMTARSGWINTYLCA